MRILISGGAGFVGSRTAQFLVDRGHKVLVVDNFSTGKTENISGIDVNVIPCDITDLDGLDGCFKVFKPQRVLHLAAQSAISTAYADPQKDMSVNGIGTLNMLKCAKKYNVQHFVFSSTSAVYEENNSWFPLSEKSKLSPQTPYGISKLACEQYIRTLFPSHVIFRYGNIYGPCQVPVGENQVIARAFRHFMYGDDFKVHGSGNQKRDFVYVYDVAYANFCALMGNITGTFNLASGKSYSVNQVLAEIEKVYEVEGYGWEHTREDDPRGDVRMNCNLVRNEFGWSPFYSLREGIRFTADWWIEKAKQ